MLRRVGIPAILVTTALVLSACGASSDKQSDDKPAPGPLSSAPISYEGREIKDTPCGPKGVESAVVDYKKPITIHTGNLRGVLSMRASTLAEGCDHFFWGRFVPSKRSRSAYVLSVEQFSITKRFKTKARYEQVSAPNPAVDALTRGTHATTDMTIQVCVRVRGLAQVKGDCLTARVV